MVELTQMNRWELSDLRWNALDAGDVKLFAACELELERLDMEEGALFFRDAA